MGGIFISYRRDDTAGYAGRLYDALTAAFGKKHVFIDVDSIHPGEDFVQAIDKSIASSSVVIVLIGKGWLNIGGPSRRRLDDPQDFVRLEVASALRQKIPVVPVLVGGATVPHPDNLPGPLKPLAHINAIEIFDQLFRDSVRHLIDELRPFVPPRSLLQRLSERDLGGVAVFALILLGALGMGALLSKLITSPVAGGRAVQTQEVTPDPSERLDGFDDPAVVRIKVTAALPVSELPPVVEASKNVVLPGSSSQVTGPSKPRILWRAKVTVGNLWSVLGVAADGTAYVYDTASHVLDAIRDGKEIWVHSSPSPIGFDAEGRVWSEEFNTTRLAEDFYSFNSRGEGGRITKKALLPDPARLRLPVSFQLSTVQRSSYFCREGKISVYLRGKQPWSVELDGNCGSQDPIVAPQTGNLYVSSDAGTLYGITPNGQVLWSAPQACKDPSYKVYPVSGDDLVVTCPHQALYALRAGKPLWTSTLGASGDWSWENVISDAAGNIYLGAEEPPEKGYMSTGNLIALDKAGKQRWTVSAGTSSGTPKPIGFDAQGTLYVSVRAESIVAVSQ